MKHIQQNFSVPFAYSVYFTHKLFHTGNPLLFDVFQSSSRKVQLFWVIDHEVAENHPSLKGDISTYISQYPGQLSMLGEPMIVPGGEEAKNDYALVDRIIQKVEEEKIDRHAYILAIGGGAVLDMVGFAASIAHRGIRHIRIPTTVLSQNDSGVGVKNGVNYFGKKNFVGNFAPPFAVINDSAFLTTLHERDWRAGISEALKVALIKDKDFFESIDRDCTKLNQRNMEAMEDLIFRCADMHLDHIKSGDPFELGSSRPLDFGHWSAHKLEQLTNYELRHGEAVAIGIALDVVYSFYIGKLSECEMRRVLSLIKELGFLLFVPELEAKIGEEWAILMGLEEFREHLGGKLTIMLLEEIGKGFEVHEIDNEKMIEAITYLKKYSIPISVS